MTNSYIVAEDNVASKIIDQEAIAINLLTGDYFSFSGCAPVIWKLLMTGADIGQLLAAVRDAFDDVPADAAGQLSDFLDQLIAEQLVIPQSASAAPAALGPQAAERRRYEAPGIDKFDDMAMMLALDPPMPELPAHLGDRRSAGKG
jgi:hypothetical protein